jgi:hypothetical protein
MPNWVNNQLVIKGAKNILSEIAERGKPFYTVKKGMSIPEFLRDLLKDSYHAESYVNQLIDQYKDVVPTEDGHIPVIDIYGNHAVFTFENFVPQQTDDPRYQNGKEAHCTTKFNWYDWNIDNWGTKWDASETRLSWECDDLVINFDTAWDVPHEFIEKLSHMYPDVIIDVYAYEEQGQFSSGRYAGGYGEMAPWVFCNTQADRESIAINFLDSLAKANNIENIFNIVDLDAFINEAYFDVQEEDDIRNYENPTIRINYCDDPKDLVEWLNSASKGTWAFDCENNKYIYYK